jgi:hypothetical protein
MTGAVLGAVLGAVAAAVAVLWWRQDALIYVPSDAVPSPADVGLPGV